MIICNDYNDAKLTAISLLADWCNCIKELTITYNEENKRFEIDCKEFSEDECEKIFGEDE